MPRIETGPMAERLRNRREQMVREQERRARENVRRMARVAAAADRKAP